MGSGVDAYIWRTNGREVLKIFRHERDFRQERAVYLRLQEHGVVKLRGFALPDLLDYDESNLVLKLSFVEPPFILDFAAAGLDKKPSGFDFESEDWRTEKSRLYGRRWPDVLHLLEALRHMGIHYRDVHRGNIRIEP